MKNIYFLLLTTLLIFNCENESVTQPEDQACDNGTFVGDVVLNTQQEVDDFGAMCYSEIQGNLTIGVEHPTTVNELTDISNLEALGSLIKVSNGLMIINNPNLVTLDGLQNLAIIKGKGISIQRCNALTSLEPLQNVTSEGSLERLEIINNESLTNLIGLEGITNVDRVRIFYCSGLTSLNGLENIESVNIITIHGTSITNLQGLYHYTHLDNFYIWDNQSLTSLLGIQSLTSIGGLYIWNNGVITSDAIKTGLDNIESIGFLNIENNSNILSLDILNSQTQVEALYIGNDNIVDLSTLDSNVAANLDNIQINKADNLISLSGLENISGDLSRVSLTFNPSLTSIEGLINTTGIDFLGIYGNPQLQTLDGLDNVTTSNIVTIGVQINNEVDYGNTQLMDFCALQNLFANVTPDIVQIGFNAYNPTVQDIIDGNCSQ